MNFISSFYDKYEFHYFQLQVNAHPVRSVSPAFVVLTTTVVVNIHLTHFQRHNNISYLS